MKRTFLLLCLLGLMGTMVPAQNTILQKGYKKALFIGAHPDDNESCAGGTMILLQNGEEGQKSKVKSQREERGKSREIKAESKEEGQKSKGWAWSSA